MATLTATDDLDIANLNLNEVPENTNFFAGAAQSASLKSSAHPSITWGILNGPVLLLFKATPKKDEMADSVLGLENTVVTETGDTTFTIASGGKEAITFTTENSDATKKWVQALTDAAKESSPIELSADDKQKLLDLEAKLAKANIFVSENKRLEVIRFLKSKNWDIDQTFEAYQDYLRWRKEFGADQLKMKDVQKEVMTGKVEFLETYDKAERPIVIFKARYHQKNESTIMSITQLIVYVMDRVLEIAPNQQVTWIVDMGGITKDSVDVRVPKTIMEILTHRYPYAIGLYMIVDQPVFFSALWVVINKFLDNNLRQRIQIIGGDKDKLFNFIDRSKLPTDLGGSMEFNARDWIRSRYKVEGFTIGQTDDNSKKDSSVQSRIMAALSSEPPVEDVLSGCTKSGHMYKESGWLKRYQKQFFVLRENLLYYYKDEKSKKPDGIVGLNRVKLEDGQDKIKHAHSFFLTTTLRPYNFYCDNDQEKQAWMQAIKGEMLNV